MKAQQLLFIWNNAVEKGLLEQLGYLHGVNNTSIHLVRNHQTRQRTKHIEAQHHFVKDLWDDQTLEINYINISLNEADICTRNVLVRHHENYKSNIREGRLYIRNEYKTLTLNCLKGKCQSCKLCLSNQITSRGRNGFKENKNGC